MAEPRTCDTCGSWSALPVDEREMFQVPDDVDVDELCRDCHQDMNVHSPEDMDDAALIAAIMDDSRGYADPHHAKQHVDQYRDGESFAYCERATACFPADPNDFEDGERAVLTGHPPGDLSKLMESARRHWMALSEDKQDELLKFAEAWAEAEEAGEISSISLAYPTLGV